MNIEEQIRAQLIANIDEAYKAFHEKLIPTISSDRILGVRVPVQRKIAKAYKNDPDAIKYMALTSHRYMEEVNIHGLLVAQMKDFDACVDETTRFLPMIDNWATCDIFSPQVFKKNLDEMRKMVPVWLDDRSHPYTVRFGINMLMQHCLETAFVESDLAAVAACACDEYYVNMGVAWYFSMALVKQWDAALPWITEHRMPDWVHRKSIQKAVESRRVSDERKALLKSYR